MICSICQDALLVDDFHAFFITDKETKPHHLTYTSLKSSVDAGCYACNRLWACLAAEERQFVTSSTGRELDGNNKPALGVNQGVDGNKEKPVTTIDANDGERYGHAGSYLFHPMERHSLRTDSVETLLLAKRWVTECVENHDQCKASPCTDTDWYPTRLLDCGPPGEEKSRCRLITTKDVSLNEPYMTLSHCWGRVECLSLTTENHDLLKSGIPFEDLPLLYQEAISVTRYLGVRHLWIDSLCIIQQGDNHADWRHEATLMNEVYSNLFCNISATNAPNSHHSMFSERNPAALYPDGINPRLNGRLIRHRVLDYCFWEKEMSHALINTRAWVFQERLLSPRVLHFGERQILWECESKDAAEIYPEDLPVDLSWSFKRFKGFTLDDTAKAPGDFRIYLYWAEIVKAYTVCKLTFPSDKLIALSAVAKRMTRFHGDEYVAGMWRRYLERELIWSVSERHADRSARPIMTPPAYSPPSWSWAATEGRINPGVPNVAAADILIRVHDFNLDYATSDRTGLVTGGWLRLWGVLKPLLLTAYHFPTAPSDADWEMAVNGIHVSVPSDSWAREPQPHVLLDRPRPNFDEQNSDSELFCMPARIGQTDEGSLYVLLLELQDRGKGVFRRIGMARGWGKEVRQKLLARNREEDKLPCEEYRDGRHLIRII
ncbi:hypothetical protein CMUS01_12029 [Colletotrichum musicola]|uniref:Heterokaryon incompatibility domain-containing protein n=1 Tax=Colletotrichum musicola TaxID=2175873 RepID=A0A8H6JRH9_9PEZI|nr:hypothetical protein CMUS01_12029 [Colletotrichum musicola]